MNKNLFLTTGLLLLAAITTINSNLQAQVLEAPAVPELGVSFSNAVAEADILDAGESGENMVWDYTGIVPVQVINYTYEPSTNSPFSDDYPYADWLLDDGVGQYFFSLGPDFNTYYGGIENGVSYPIEGGEVYYPYPFPFEEPFTSTMTTELEAQGMTIYREGEVNSVLDGYGTLQHPSGMVFEDVNRVRISRTLRDSASEGVANYYLEYVHFYHDTIVPPIVQHTHILITEGVEEIVVDTIFSDSLNTVIDTVLIDTILPTVTYDMSYVEVLQSIANSQEEPEAPSFAMFPNPATDRVTMKWYNTPDAIEFRDATGRLVHTEYAIPGINATQVDVSGWARGVYTATAIVGEQQTTKQLVIQ